MGDEVYDPCHEHGGMSRWAYEDDPKRLAFTLARYKHVAKMLEGYGRVLEVGCADGFGSRIVRQHVRTLVASSSDRESMAVARRASSDCWHIWFEVGSITDGMVLSDLFWRGFDAVYALDVLEHISPDEHFLRNMAAAAPVAIIGTPSLESQQYASRLSKLGHVNCYSGPVLRDRLLTFWKHAFMFAMHDETLGTSYLPMAQYLLALCVEPR